MNARASLLDELRHEILRDIYDEHMLLTALRDRPDGWTLVSGEWSPFYLQLRLLSSYPKTLRKIARGLAIVLEENLPDVNRLVGIAYAGVPIATALSLESGIPACHTRKVLGVRTTEELKRAIEQYGQHAIVEGEIQSGDYLCIVDDLVTAMDSKLVARDMVLSEVHRRGVDDVVCDSILVVIDRQQGAKERALELALNLQSLIRFVDDGLPILRGIMPPEEYEMIRNYLVPGR